MQSGWNVTGDTYVMDKDRYFWYQARSDDMIISSGYNIAGPEVESALLTHAAVAECGVVGAPDEERGQIVKAYIVLRPGQAGGDAMTKQLQDHVKATVAPYKYPRAIEYVTELPKTQTGKLQRFELRKKAAETRQDNSRPRGEPWNVASAAPSTLFSRRAGRSRRAMPTASRRAASSCSSAAWSAGTRTRNSPKASSRRRGKPAEYRGGAGRGRREARACHAHDLVRARHGRVSRRSQELARPIAK